VRPLEDRDCLGPAHKRGHSVTPFDR
jgi:hypothetical protein